MRKYNHDGGYIYGFVYFSKNLYNIAISLPDWYTWPAFSTCLLLHLKLFSHSPKRSRVTYASDDGVHTLYFFSETDAWNHFVLYMPIGLVI